VKGTLLEKCILPPPHVLRSQGGREILNPPYYMPPPVPNKRELVNTNFTKQPQKDTCSPNLCYMMDLIHEAETGKTSNR